MYKNKARQGPKASTPDRSLIRDFEASYARLYSGQSRIPPRAGDQKAVQFGQSVEISPQDNQRRVSSQLPHD